MDLRSSSDSPFEEPTRPLETLPTVLEAPAGLEQVEAKAPSLSPFRASFRRFRRDKRAVISLLLLLTIGMVSVILLPIYEHIGEPLHKQIIPGYVITITPEQYHSPEYLDEDHMMQYPSALHWLGTDDNGQDILARLLRGWQVSLFIALAVLAQEVLLGTFFGVLAGYLGGLLDSLLSRFTDLMFAFPGILFALLVASIFGRAFDDVVILGIQFGPYGRVVLECLILGVLSWPQMARYVRAQTLQLKEQPFVEAARVSGTGALKIIVRHILPNVGNLILVVISLDLVGAVGADGALSFLGLGVQPPGSGLGLMVSVYSAYLQPFSYELLWPILALMILTLAGAFIADGVQAAFDPRDQDYGLIKQS